MVVTTQIYICVKIYGEFVPKEKVHFAIIKTSVEVIHYRLQTEQARCEKLGFLSST